MSLYPQNSKELTRNFLAGLSVVLLFALLVVEGSSSYARAASTKTDSSGGYDVKTTLDKPKNVGTCQGSGCPGRTLGQRCEQIFKSIKGGTRFMGECCNKDNYYLANDQCQKDIKPYLDKIPKNVMDQLREISTTADEAQPTVDVPGLSQDTQPDAKPPTDATKPQTAPEADQIQSQLHQLEAQIEGFNAQAQVLMGQAQAVDAENRSCVATCQGQVDACSATKGCDAAGMTSSCQAKCDAIETSNHGIIDQVIALAAQRNAAIKQQDSLKARLDALKKPGSGTSSTAPKNPTRLPASNTKKINRIFRPVY